MKIRIISVLILMFTVFFYGTVNAFAYFDDYYMTEYYDKPRVTVNGEFVKWTDAHPFIDKNNRTQVPLRASMEACGLDVKWDADARCAIVKDNKTTVVVPIGYKYIYINGEKKNIDTAAQIVSSRTYLPIRAVSEAFGYGVLWNGDYEYFDNSSYYHTYTCPWAPDYRSDGPLISLVKLPFNLKGFNHSGNWWVDELRVWHNGYAEYIGYGQESNGEFLKGLVRYNNYLVFLTGFGTTINIHLYLGETPDSMNHDDYCEFENLQLIK